MSFKIYTKTGDKGYTSLFGGSRVLKSDLRIEAYGTLDELNAHLGFLNDFNELEKHRVQILDIQDQLMRIGSVLACDDIAKAPFHLLKIDAINSLEKWIDQFETVLPPLKTFILPGGNQASSACHIARCVCRRAERALVDLNSKEEYYIELIKYMNRLSDYLFVLARTLLHDNKGKDIPWIP